MTAQFTSSRTPSSKRGIPSHVVWFHDFAEVVLTRGKRCRISLCDVPAISRFRWHCTANGYAARRGRDSSGKSKIFLMHRELVSPGDGMYTDHVDGDTLNNQRSNLRAATPSQNAMNKRGRAPRSRIDPRSKGVCFAPELNKTNPWMAYISAGRKRHHLGYFPTAEAASVAYQKAAKEMFGSFLPV